MWRVFFLLLSYLISASAYAISLDELPAHEPNPELVQAESLLKTDPAQALDQLNLFIDKPDRSLTASNSVRNLNLQYLQQSRENMFQALLLKSQAQNKTGNVRGALKTLDYVTQMAKNHNNAYIQAKAILLQAKYEWEQSGNPQEAVQTLNSCVEYRYTFANPCLPPGNGLAVSIKSRTFFSSCHIERH